MGGLSRSLWGREVVVMVRTPHQLRSRQPLWLSVMQAAQAVVVVAYYVVLGLKLFGVI